MRLQPGFASAIAATIGIASGLAASAAAYAFDEGGPNSRHAKHVLLISIDGMHEKDLAKCIAASTCPTLAGLAGKGIRYSDAHTTTPSDSFPGLLSMVTGGTPKTTGVYYDDSYDRTYFAPNDTTCSTPGGIEAVFDESIEYDDSQIFGGGGINPHNLPRHKVGDDCKPVYPHEFVKVNTIFEVIRSAGYYTAWSDKHFAYDLVNGPSGRGVIDLYTPEINSDPANGGVVNGVDLTGSKAKCDGTTNSLPLTKVTDYTTCIPTVEAYDDTKVQAVINEINGLSSDGTKPRPVPAILGMNFQAVSVGEKLPVGGYTDASGTPSAELRDAISHTDGSIGRIVSALSTARILDSTLIIISAKHGQSPIDKTQLQMESGGSGDTSVVDPSVYIGMVDATVDTASTFTNPNSGNAYSTHGHFQTDDTGLLWLENQSPSNIAGVVSILNQSANRAMMHADTLPAGTIFASSINSGSALAAIYGDPTDPSDRVAAARAPNVIIQPNHGVIYSGSSKKIAEHGGGTTDDTHVAMLVSGPGVASPGKFTGTVETTQIAPSILCALGLDPRELEAVRREGTTTLPGLSCRDGD